MRRMGGVIIAAMDLEIEAHCREIDCCNQRGGRMLSVIDLIGAGTMSCDLAAYALAAISRGASFMVGALPGGAGKTTVMGALLNFMPAEVSPAAADGIEAIERGMAAPTPRRCYICHEIGRGSYYAYLWGPDLRAYFRLLAVGHMLATNLHADTFEAAHDQVCRTNGVAEGLFRKMNLVFFLSVEQMGPRAKRRIGEVWESDGLAGHQWVYDANSSARIRSEIVSEESLAQAKMTIDEMLAAKVRTTVEVRRFLVNQDRVK
jgi:hypothetical protein